MTSYIWASSRVKEGGGGPLSCKLVHLPVDKVYRNQFFGSNFLLRRDFLLKLGVELSGMCSQSFQSSSASVRSISDRTVKMSQTLMVLTEVRLLHPLAPTHMCSRKNHFRVKLSYVDPFYPKSFVAFFFWFLSLWI